MKTASQLAACLLYPLFGGAVLIAAWYALIAVLDLHPFLLPAPHHVVSAMIKEWELIWRAAIVTFSGAGIGFALAVTCGFLTSLAMVSLQWLRRSLYPYVLIMQMTPVISVAAIIVILFDVGLQSVAMIAFFIGFFPVVASTLQGLISVPRSEIELFRLYRASPLQELLLLRIPHSLPYFFTGAKIAATLAVIGSVTGEIFAGSSDGSGGLGFQIILFKSELKIAAIYAATAVCCLMGFTFVGVVLLFRHLALRHWHDSALSKES